MTDVVGKKQLDRFKGTIEYLLEYKQPLMCGHEPDAEHHETETFINVKDLLRLVSDDFLDTMKHAHAADDIRVSAVYLDAKNDEGDSATVWIADEVKAWSSAKVDTDVIDSKMSQYIDRIEIQLNAVLSTIKQSRT